MITLAITFSLRSWSVFDGKTGCESHPLALSIIHGVGVRCKSGYILSGPFIKYPQFLKRISTLSYFLPLSLLLPSSFSFSFDFSSV